jgi:PPOX class probable F420-dependent enzyme
VLDLTTPAGARADQRLRAEEIVWITTVRADGQPQTSPVWFWWDGATFLVYSQPGAQKVRNLSANPRVSLHLDGDGRGGDVVTVDGAAELGPAEPHAGYLEKYGASIARIGYAPEGLLQDYSVAIEVTPSRARVY